MRLGQAAMEALRAEVSGQLIPGEELVAVGACALPGTAALTAKMREQLRPFFSEAFLREAQGLSEKFGIHRESIQPEEEALPEGAATPWELAVKYGADALYEAGEGGILAALWKVAEASQVGLRVDLRRIPVRQETIEICERLDVNPYQLFSEGCLLTGMKNGTSFVQACKKRGYPARIIGETTDGNDRLLFSGTNVRYLERPRPDELHRFL